MVRNRMIADRLLDLLTTELSSFEASVKEYSPNIDGDAKDARASGKERIETIAHLARTLDKLLDVRRAEAAQATSHQEDDAETERLRAEFLKRLKILDRKRRGENGSAAGAATAGTGGARGEHRAVAAV